MGCSAEGHHVNVPRILHKYRKEIEEAFNGAEVWYYESEKCEEETTKI
jgi:hypothetical protein